MSLALANPEAISTAIIPIERAHVGKYAGGRRTRWAREPRTLLVTTGSGQTLEGSRWGHVENKPYLPPPFLDFPPCTSLEQTDQFLREQRLEELNKKLLLGDFEVGDPDVRPPSPAPIYDKEGNRTNRRDVRIQAAMSAEQQRLVEHMVSTVPGFTPSAEFRPQKRVRRILIPIEDFPEYNFMGLIIGPRGCNHKRLEADSGAQISIRGRGTQKEGKRCDHQTDEEAAMPQHVHIAADSEEKLERAVQLIEPLLDPSHPIHEEFKKRGLEQLALVNGTQGFVAKADARCTVCGQAGHFGYECPETRFETYEMADVRCLLCGDRGHVTSDCKIAANAKLTPEQIAAMEAESQQGRTPEEIAAAFQSSRNDQQEFQKMMTELGLAPEGSLSSPPPPPPVPDSMWSSTARMKPGIGFVGDDHRDFQMGRDGTYRSVEAAAPPKHEWYPHSNYVPPPAWQQPPPEQPFAPPLAAAYAPQIPADPSAVFRSFAPPPNPQPGQEGAWSSQAAQAVLNMMTIFQQQQQQQQAQQSTQQLQSFVQPPPEPSPPAGPWEPGLPPPLPQ